MKKEKEKYSFYYKKNLYKRATICHLYIKINGNFKNLVGISFYHIHECSILKNAEMRTFTIF